jgi:repressor LexA
MEHIIKRTSENFLVSYKEEIYMEYGKISAKQKEILDFIKAEILQKGYPPSVREICEAVHLKSTSSVHSHLETLEKNGYIKRDPTKPRTIEIKDGSFQKVRHDMTSIPVIGTVAAGVPILAEQNIEGYFPIPSEMVPEGDSFVFKVNDDNMIKVGIYKGDSVFVHACDAAENGDIIVAATDNSVTVKTYNTENGQGNIEILGKVFGVFRLYQ